MAEPSRRVSYSQLEQLWEFLNENRALALGYNKSSQAREFSRRMWENIAVNLNSHASGAVNWRGWCKYWNDYKCKIKKLAAGTRAAQQITGGGAPHVRSMGEIEKKFLSILGSNFGSGLPGVRIEPFDEISQEIPLEVPLPSTEPSSAPLPPTAALPSTTAVAGCGEPATTGVAGCGEPATTAVAGCGEPATTVVAGCGEPATTAVAGCGKPATTAVAGCGEPATTPRRTPRRRRRREPPMGQEAARRSLIRMSERKMEIHEKISESLINLLQEMKEIKLALQCIARSGRPINEA